MSIGRVPGETGIQPSIVTAKGDLIVATANGSVTNQAVGSNNQVLMADSAQADGVKWANEATSTLTTTGDILYASAANTLARRAIGSTGDVLTVSGGVPTWAAPASGGMTLISTTTFNGTPTTVLSSIPSTYNDLRVVIRLALPATTTVRLSMRFNNDSTASRHGAYTSNNDTNSAGYAFDSTSCLFQFATNVTSQGLFIANIFDYANTSTWKMAQILGLSNSISQTSEFRLFNGTAMYNQTAAISSLGFLWSSGNATSGTILLYGVK